MIDKLTANAVVIAAFAAGWAWLDVRVRILRRSGAAPYAKRLALQHAVVFGGMAVAVSALIWVPGPARDWLYWSGAALVTTAFVVVAFRSARESRPESVVPQPGTRRRARRMTALILAVSWGVPVTSGVVVGLVTHSFGWGMGVAVLTAAVVMLISFPVVFVVSAVRRRDKAQQSDQVRTP